MSRHQYLRAAMLFRQLRPSQVFRSSSIAHGNVCVHSPATQFRRFSSFLSSENDEILYEIEKLKEEQARANLLKNSNLMSDLNFVNNVNDQNNKDGQPKPVSGAPTVEVFNRLRRTNRPRADDPSAQDRFERAMQYKSRKTSS